MARSVELLSLLMELEVGLRQLQLWQPLQPSPEALCSDQPFCIDTLSFPQWLQFILLPRLRGLLEAGQPLPTNSEIGPMAEEYLKSAGPVAQALIDSIHCLDRQLSCP